MSLGDMLLASAFLDDEDEIREKVEKELRAKMEQEKMEAVEQEGIRAREEIKQELMDRGTLLPEYNWQDRAFNDELEAITADWFARHPETKRGTGEFQAKYPEKMAALDLMERMSAMGRITPEEYIIIYREIHNF